MGASDNSASPKEVELIQEIQRPTKKSKREKEPLEVVITFWTHVGWDGALILFCMLGMSGIFLYITDVVSYWYSRNFGRKYVWFFSVDGWPYFVKLFPFLDKMEEKAVLFTGRNHRSIQNDIVPTNGSHKEPISNIRTILFMEAVHNRNRGVYTSNSQSIPNLFVLHASRVFGSFMHMPCY